MIKLPCGAEFEIYRDKEANYTTPEYLEIIVKDKETSFSEIRTYDIDEAFKSEEVLQVTLHEKSLWSIIRELERYAKENNIQETK